MEGNKAPLSIGNCNVVIQGSDFICESTPTHLQISLLDAAKMNISMSTSRKYMTRKSSNADPFLNLRSGESGGDSSSRGYSFLLVNPKDGNSHSKLLLQEVQKIYMKELPTMNYAANTGKESLFIEKCVSSGKYCTLLLKSNSIEGSGEVIAAVSYQIIPADTQYAEIPLAAVSSNYQHKGIGHLLYMDLRNRLQNVGVLTIFCWGDKESERFWLKQGFISIAEVDTKGRARRLPIKADIRRALCFPGGSTLMVVHLGKDTAIPAKPTKHVKFPPNSHASPSPVPFNNPEFMEKMEVYGTPKTNILKKEDVLSPIIDQLENSQPIVLSTDEQKIDGSSTCDYEIQSCTDLVPWNGVECNSIAVEIGVSEKGYRADGKQCSCYGQGIKRRVWESSQSSLKSKKVKGGHLIEVHLDFDGNVIHGNECRKDADIGHCSVGTSKDKSSVEVFSNDPLCASFPLHDEENRPVYMMSSEDHSSEEPLLKAECPRIMLMNIADDIKKARLIKIIEELGGVVTSNGSVSTHVITGKARRTLNFCTALCSGAWIISPNWLKVSFREGKFVDELPFVLKDEDYVLKHKSQLKDAVLRAKENPHALLKGYDIYLATHIQPPADILSAIVKSAGGNVCYGLDNVQDPSRTIFVACEEDMEEALVAAKGGVWTYSSDWFMSCILRQELDLEAPQFAESL